MKLYQETRIQALMIATSAFLLVMVLALILAGLIQSHMPFLFGAAGLALVTFIIIAIGQRWTQRTLDRCQRIREGYGDEADLEWLKTRKSSGFKKVNK